MLDGAVGLTGYRGVIGSRLYRRLVAQGFEVLPFEGDVRDAASVSRWGHTVSSVIHCAALVPTVQVSEDLERAIQTNVIGTYNVAALARANPDFRVMYLSTSHVYERQQQAIPEDASCQPSSLYGLTKRQGEQWVAELVENHQIVRIFSYFAGDQGPSYLLPGLVNRLMASEKDAELPLMGAHAQRDITDADWVADVILALWSSDCRGSINCGSGVAWSILDIANKTASIVGRDDVKFTPQTPGTDVDCIVADTSKIRSILGDLPEFDMNKALRSAVRGLIADD